MNVTPALSKEIVRRFQKRTGGTAVSTVSTDLAAFVVRLSLFQSPQRDEKGNVAETPEAIETMAEDISKFLAECSPHVIATLSLQCQTSALRGVFAGRRRSEQVKQEAVTIRLLRSLCENSTRLPEEMLSEIAFFILHRYQQLRNSGGEGEVATRKETAAVLSAVLPRAQVKAFAAQSGPEKQRQLEELRRIVWGIRLYNAAEGRTAGEGLIALHDATESAVEVINQKLLPALKTVASSCEDYAMFLRSPSAPIAGSERQTLREEYHRQLQLLLNLRLARQRLHELLTRIRGSLLPAYDTALTELRSVLGNGAMRSDGVTLHSSVPKRTVYPKFIALAEAYEDAERSLYGFEEIRALLDLSLSLGTLTNSSLPPTLLSEARKSAKEDPPADRAALETFFTSKSSSPINSENRLVYAADSTILHDQYLASRAFHGLCPVSLVEEGICVIGRNDNDNIIMINKNEKEGEEKIKDPAFPGFLVQCKKEGINGEWYAFRSESALRRFATSPLSFIDRINIMAREEIVLIGLLDMYDRLPRELYIRGTRKYETRDITDKTSITKDFDKTAGKTSCEAGTQTGQRDPYMDHNYRWNEWDLRRQALKLVNLLDMRTHSTQTIASHFRRDNATQVRPPRDDATQTMQDAAVQPPRTVQYLKGLRGTKTSAIETVQKTFLY